MYSFFKGLRTGAFLTPQNNIYIHSYGHSYTEGLREIFCNKFFIIIFIQMTITPLIWNVTIMRRHHKKRRYHMRRHRIIVQVKKLEVLLIILLNNVYNFWCFFKHIYFCSFQMASWSYSSIDRRVQYKTKWFQFGENVTEESVVLNCSQLSETWS